MSKTRYILINFLIAYILGFSLLCILSQKEIWPFSNYPMYSKVYRSDYTRLLVYGITADSEIDLNSSLYWQGLSSTNVRKVLVRVEADAPRFRSALEHLKNSYENARAAGRHAGPDIVGLRFYNCGWELDLERAAKSRDCHTREMLYEYRFRAEGT